MKSIVNSKKLLYSNFLNIRKVFPQQIYVYPNKNKELRKFQSRIRKSERIYNNLYRSNRLEDLQIYSSLDSSLKVLNECYSKKIQSRYSELNNKIDKIEVN